MLNQEHRTVNECCSGHSALSLVRVGGFRLHLGVGGVMKEVGDFALLFTAAQIGGIQIKKKKWMPSSSYYMMLTRMAEF